MALKKRMCSNHPDRAATGICILTKKPVCLECSTRYEGVNYSKEGLELLKQQRSEKAKQVSLGQRLVSPLLLLLIPIFLSALYFFYIFIAETLIDLAQIELFS